MTVITELATDPGGYSVAWTDTLLCGNKFVRAFGNSHNPTGNNSVRLFDVSANSWSYLAPNTSGDVDFGGQLNNRDNHISWIDPVRNHFVVAYDVTGNYFGGVFDLNTNTWIERWPVVRDASGVVIGYDSGGYLTGDVGNAGAGNAAHAWSDYLDAAVEVCGNFSSPVSKITVWRRSETGYVLETHDLSASVPARTYLRSAGCCVGKYFYFCGGQVGSTRFNDFYKIDLDTFAVTRLADLPQALRYPFIAYDSDHDVIVLIGGDNADGRSNGIYAYDRGADTWTDHTTPDLMPCTIIGGDYVPGFGFVIGSGTWTNPNGQRWQDALRMWRVQIDATGTAPDPTPTSPTKDDALSALQYQQDFVNGVSGDQATALDQNQVVVDYLNSL